ncbi:hypothetical protein [Massilia sp. TN1-12]|uniref:hypothetical protein n=1 Tax=Massilia paldalensis TaxID=3377675 RepID=UPI0038503352
MAKKVGDYKIPFDKAGNQLHYEGYGNTDWRDNAPFEDTLTYEGFSHGRSAAYFHFKRKDGAGVTVFMKEMSEMIPRLVNGQISGTFAFVKRGKNYGCTMQ